MGGTLRLVWPQWQGVGTSSLESEYPEQPVEVARLGYPTGTQVLAAVLPAHDGPTAAVPVDMDVRSPELAVVDGIEARPVVLRQLRSALTTIADHDPDRIATVGGECSVSVAPFAHLAARYGDDLAIVWIDSHPDVGTPESAYPGHHAMAVSLLVGHGDEEFVAALPATVDPSRVALVGLHAWTDDDIPHVADWGISSFSPDDLRTSSDELLAWLRRSGATKVAVHLDVDTVDKAEGVFGLGAEPDGLTIEQVRRVVADVAGAADVVAFTVAEYIPRQVIRVQQLLDGMPLL